MSRVKNKYPAGFISLTAITLLCTAVYIVTTVSPVLESWSEHLFGLSSDLSLPSVLWQPFTYAFFHASPLHLFFNLAVIYVFGRSIVLFGNGRYLLPIFAAGSLAGAFFYIVFYGLMLGRSSLLVGASAGALALALATAVSTPKIRVDILGFARMAVIPLTVAVVLLSSVGLAGGNFGGAIAHLGGIAAGIGAGAIIRRKNTLVNERIAVLRKELDRLRRRIDISGYESLDENERQRFIYLSSIFS